MSTIDIIEHIMGIFHIMHLKKWLTNDDMYNCCNKPIYQHALIKIFNCV